MGPSSARACGLDRRAGGAGWQKGHPCAEAVPLSREGVICWLIMDDVPVSLVLPPTSERHRLHVGLRLQQTEGNPLTGEEIAMFEMFEREAWTPGQRRAYILGHGETAGGNFVIIH